MSKGSLASAVILFAAVTSTLRGQTPLNSEFTYQGQLRASGLPAIAAADFKFALFDAPSAGTQVGSTISSNNVALSDGVFFVTLNFGQAAFNGQARWLEVAVRSPAGVGGFVTLAPRQSLTAAPNATYSLQTRGISVSPSGDVGIGSLSSASDLSVAGDVSLGTSAGQYRKIRVQAGNTAGFLFSALQGISAGIHLAFNHLIDEAGDIEYIHAGGTSRVSLNSGSIALAINSESSQPPIERLILDEQGAEFRTNVGINTPLPEAALHVDGSMRMDVNLSGGDGNFNVYDEDGNPIWALGKSFTLDQPIFVLISPVTGDLEGGFYRDDQSGNGVMFADDKNFRAPNPADAATDIWYCCPEGPEAAMYVRGIGRLIDGRATIELPDHFRNLASEPGMTVQLTPRSLNSKGLATSKVSLAGIEVGELGGGKGNYEFDWRVEAVRKGWEDYKVVRPWMQSDKDPDKAWANRLKWIEERKAHGKPAPETDSMTPRSSH